MSGVVSMRASRSSIRHVSEWNVESRGQLAGQAGLPTQSRSSQSIRSSPSSSMPLLHTSLVGSVVVDIGATLVVVTVLDGAGAVEVVVVTGGAVDDVVGASLVDVVAGG